MKKLLQVRIPQRMLKEYSLDITILVALEEILSVEVHWSATKKHILLLDPLGRMDALVFSKQLQTLERQYTNRERLRFHITIDERFLKK